MTFTFAFENSKARTFDFVNVMNSYIAIRNHLFVFRCCLHFKMLVHGKCKYNHKTLPKKYQALKDLDKGLSNKDVAAKFGKRTW